jgi:hypothetical protein
MEEPSFTGDAAFFSQVCRRPLQCQWRTAILEKRSSRAFGLAALINNGFVLEVLVTGLSVARSSLQVLWWMQLAARQSEFGRHCIRQIVADFNVHSKLKPGLGFPRSYTAQPTTMCRAAIVLQGEDHREGLHGRLPSLEASHPPIYQRSVDYCKRCCDRLELLDTIPCASS